MIAWKKIIPSCLHRRTWIAVPDRDRSRGKSCRFPQRSRSSFCRAPCRVLLNMFARLLYFPYSTFCFLYRFPLSAVEHLSKVGCVPSTFIFAKWGTPSDNVRSNFWQGLGKSYVDNALSPLLQLCPANRMNLFPGDRGSCLPNCGCSCRRAG
jgi:hypothetical protein